LLNTTNSKTNGANKVVVTDNAGLINYNLLKASTTPTASYIPIANSSNKLDNNWLNNVVSSSGATDKSKFVLTNSSGKINNNLLNTTTTPTASSIPLSDSNGKINDAWLTTTVTSTPNTIVKLDSTGKLDASLIKTGLFIPMTGGEPSGNILVTRPGDSANKSLDNLKSKYPNFYGFGANSYTDGFLIGLDGSSNSNNYLVIATLDDGNEPIYVRQYGGTQGYLNMANNVAHELTLMDKDGYTSVLKLTSANDIISTNGGLSVKSNITSTNGNLSINGTSSLKGNVSVGESTSKPANLTVYGTGYFVRTTDAAGATNNKPALIVGGLDTAMHLELDGNEIQAKADGTNYGTIGINIDGGNVSVGNDDKNSTVTLRKNTTITGTGTIAGNTTIGNDNSKSTLKVFGGVTADNGLTVNNAVLTANKGATIKGAVLDAQAGTKTTTLNATGAATLGSTLSVTGASTLTGAVEAKNGINVTGGNITITAGASTTSGIANYIRGQTAANDHWRIAGGATASNSGYLELATADDSTEPIHIRQYSGDFATLKRTATLLDGSGNTTFPGTVTAGGLSTTGAVSVGSLKSTGLVEAGSMKSNGTFSASGNTTIGGTLGVTGATTLSNTLTVTKSTTLNDSLTVSKATTIGGLLTANGHIIIPNGGNVVSASYNSPHLTLGSSTGTHIEIDNNEIAAKASASDVGVLYLQDGGGSVKIGGGEGTADLQVCGKVLIDNGKTLNMRAEDGSERVVLRISRTGGHGGGGDDVFLTGGGNMTAIFSGDAYGDWSSYVNNNSLATIEAEGLWSVKAAEEKDANGNTVINKYVVGVGNGKGGYSDDLYLMADKDLIIQTCIHKFDSQASGYFGYKNRKSFVFGNSGNLTVPGVVKCNNGSAELLSATKGTNYTKLSNGLIIQWGSGVEKGSDQIISFPVAFSNTKYQVVIAATDSYGGADPTYVKSKATTGFYASNDYWSNMTIYWIAIGY